MTISLPANPYIGPRAFEEGERLYGRALETERLVSLLIAERIVLLHSPSGAGKTSLIQAALLPRLREEDFTVLPVARVNQEPPAALRHMPGFNRYVFSVLSYLDEALPTAQQQSMRQLASLRLVDYLHRRPCSGETSASDEAKNEVLVIDQFEEVLTLHPTDRLAKEEFFVQLSEALTDRQRWALFSMREDYVAALSPYLLKIPTRLRITFRLDLLSVAAAFEALQHPASDVGVQFTTAAASKLIDDLRRVQVQQVAGETEIEFGAQVEPVQLQVVAYRLWESRTRNLLALSGLDSPEGQECLREPIGEDDVESLGDVDTALANYYADQVQVIATAMGEPEHQIRRWFDAKLITENGLRAQVLLETGQSGELANQIIYRLQNAHLVRAEKYGGKTWFELAHDRLIKPVLDNNVLWFASHLSLLQRQANLWDEQHRPDGLLLRGRALLKAIRWAQGNQLTKTEREFLAACQRVQSQNRRLLTMRVIVILMAIVSVIGFGLSVNSGVQADLNSQAARTAIAQVADTAEAAAAAVEQAGVQRTTARAVSTQARSNLQTVQAIRGNTDATSTWVADQKFRLNINRAEVANLESTADADHERAMQQQAAANAASIRARHQQATADAARAQAIHQQATADAAATQAIAPLTTQVVAALPTQIIAQLVTAQAASTQTTLDLRESESRRLALAADLAQKDNESELAALLGIRALKQAYSAQVYDSFLKSVSNIPLRALNGHSQTITSLTFSSTGKYMLTGSKDQTAKLWNVTTGQEVRTFTGHTSAITSVAFSPDDKYVLTGSKDHTARLWETATGQEVRAFTGYTGIVTSVAFSPDGNLVLTGGDDKAARLWMIATGQELRAFTGHIGVINSATFASDGRLVLTSSDDETAKLWVTDTGQELHTFAGHMDVVTSVASSPDGLFALTGSVDGTIKLWDMVTGMEVRTLMLDTSPVTSVAFSPDGQYLLAGSVNGTMKLWDAATGREARVITGKTGAIMSVAFSPLENSLFAAAYGTTVRIWKVVSEAKITTPSVRTFNGYTGPVSSMAFSPNGQTALIGGEEGGVELWDVATGTELRTLALAPSPVTSVAFSPNGEYILAGNIYGEMKLWETVTGREVYTVTGHTGTVRSIAFSSDSKYAVTGGNDVIAKLWVAATGQELHTFTGHTATVNSVTVSPDGKYVLTGSDDGTAKLWVADTGQIVHTFIGDMGSVTNVAFSPIGLFALTGSVDGKVKLWDVITGTEVRTLARGDNPITSVAFSPDGEYALAGSSVGTAWLWYVATGAEALAFTEHTSAVISIAFLADGQFVLTAAKDKTAKLWDINARWACSRITRDFTDTERQQYAISDTSPTCP